MWITQRMEGTNPDEMPHPERIASNYFRRNVSFALTMPTFSYQEINQLRTSRCQGLWSPKGGWESSAALWRTGCLLLISNHENNKKKHLYTTRYTLKRGRGCMLSRQNSVCVGMNATHKYTGSFFFPCTPSSALNAAACT